MRHGPFFPIVVTLAALGLAACGDEVTDPDVFLESAEAEAVMRSARQLPLLPTLMDRATPQSPRDRAVLLRAGELWAAGVVHDGRASARRRLAVGYALPTLVESIPSDDWASVRDGLGDWIMTVEGMLQHLTMPHVADRVDAARRYLERSKLSAEDARRSTYYTLLAMSELVETTPRYVAVGLLGNAHASVTEATEAGHQSERVLERAGRLKDWAERAVEEEDYLLAIQRAYYAIQLVEAP